MTKAAMIFNIQRFSIQDGPGIRSTVFFKGCPLRCRWCSNPESQNKFPEISHRSLFCNQCGKCLSVCELGAISLAETGVRIKRDICTNCGQCVKVCAFGVFQVMGKLVSVDEILAEVVRDIDFYRHSGGGVTASGGEPLMQYESLTDFFERCWQADLHTTLQTCGHTSLTVLRKVLKHTNLVLYDIKLMDTRLHKHYTGVANELILRNALEIDASGVPQIIRIPLIPTVNSFEQNIRNIAQFVKGFKHQTPVELLPYHRFGLSKYESLDRRYKLENESVPSEEFVDRIQAIFLAEGVGCKISH